MSAAAEPTTYRRPDRRSGIERRSMATRRSEVDRRVPRQPPAGKPFAAVYRADDGEWHPQGWYATEGEARSALATLKALGLRVAFFAAEEDGNA